MQLVAKFICSCRTSYSLLILMFITIHNGVTQLLSLHQAEELLIEHLKKHLSKSYL